MSQSRMKPSTHLFKTLLACFSLHIINAIILNTAMAVENNSIEVLQNDPSKIYGKVADVINTGSFTYIEVETNNEKVWAAGPVTPIQNGDMIGFSTMLPMPNFHSKSLARDFSIIYFTNVYMTDKGASTAASAKDKIKQQKIFHPNNTNKSKGSGEVDIGGYLREVTLDGLNGETKTFSALKGKPLIINIWASWCGPCRAEMGSLELLSQRYNGKNFNIIGISTDDYRDNALSFVKQTKITFDNFLDHKLLLENMLGAQTIPLTLLVDADGRILEKIRGARDWNSLENITSIREVFNINLMR